MKKYTFKIFLNLPNLVILMDVVFTEKLHKYLFDTNLRKESNYTSNILHGCPA